MPLLSYEEQHHLILMELGILDDMEDWELYKLQEARYDEYRPDHETWRKYVKTSNR